MQYESFHILDFEISDEQASGRSRCVSVSVDTHEGVNIELGSSVTLRTDEAGLHDMRDAFDRALSKIEDIRLEKLNSKMSLKEEELIQDTIDADSTALSDQQRYDVWLANDPNDW